MKIIEMEAAYKDISKQNYVDTNHFKKKLEQEREDFDSKKKFLTEQLEKATAERNQYFERLKKVESK